LNNERCRVSEEELEHDRQQAKRDECMETQDRIDEIRKEWIEVKRANILEGNGLDIMEVVTDSRTLMQDHNLWLLFKEGLSGSPFVEDGKFEDLGKAYASMIAQELEAAARDQAEEEMEI